MSERIKYTLEQLREWRNLPASQRMPEGIPELCAQKEPEKEIVLSPPRKTFPSAQDSKDKDSIKHNVFAQPEKVEWDLVLGGKSANMSITDDKPGRQRAGPTQRHRGEGRGEGRGDGRGEGRGGYQRFENRRGPDRDGSNWPHSKPRDSPDDYRFSTGDPAKDRELEKNERKGRGPFTDRERWVSEKMEEEALASSSNRRREVDRRFEKEVDEPRGGLPVKGEQKPARGEATGFVDAWFAKADPSSLLETNVEANYELLSGSVKPSTRDPFLDRPPARAPEPTHEAPRSRFANYFSTADEGIPSSGLRPVGPSSEHVTLSALRAITSAPMKTVSAEGPSSSNFGNLSADAGRHIPVQSTDSSSPFNQPAVMPPNSGVGGGRWHPQPDQWEAAQRTQGMQAQRPVWEDGSRLQGQPQPQLPQQRPQPPLDPLRCLPTDDSYPSRSSVNRAAPPPVANRPTVGAPPVAQYGAPPMGFSMNEQSKPLNFFSGGSARAPAPLPSQQLQPPPQQRASEGGGYDLSKLLYLTNRSQGPSGPSNMMMMAEDFERRLAGPSRYPRS